MLELNRVWFQNVSSGEMTPVAQPPTRQSPFFDQRNTRGFSEVIWMPSKVASWSEWKNNDRLGAILAGGFRLATHRRLAGGFKYFSIFIPTWRNDPIWRVYFSDGLVQAPTFWWRFGTQDSSNLWDRHSLSAVSHSGRSVPLLPLWSQVGGWHWGGWHGETNGKTNGNQVEWILWEVAFLRCGEFLKTAFLVLKHKVEWFFQP